MSLSNRTKDELLMTCATMSMTILQAQLTGRIPPNLDQFTAHFVQLITEAEKELQTNSSGLVSATGRPLETDADRQEIERLRARVAELEQHLKDVLDREFKAAHQ